METVATPEERLKTRISGGFLRNSGSFESKPFINKCNASVKISRLRKPEIKLRIDPPHCAFSGESTVHTVKLKEQGRETSKSLSQRYAHWTASCFSRCAIYSACLLVWTYVLGILRKFTLQQLMKHAYGSFHSRITLKHGKRVDAACRRCFTAQTGPFELK